jgi:hypothetical protein
LASQASLPVGIKPWETTLSKTSLNRTGFSREQVM